MSASTSLEFVAVPGACDGTSRRDLEVPVHVCQAFIAIVPVEAIAIVFHFDVTILVIGASASIAPDSGESGERLGTISSLANDRPSVSPVNQSCKSRYLFIFSI